MWLNFRNTVIESSPAVHLALCLLACGLLASCRGTQQSAILEGNSCLRAQDYGCAIEQYERAVDAAPSDGHALTNLAWVLATAPAPEYRDGERAVELATEAVAVAERDGVLTENLGYLVALAAAHAETGDFDQAVLVIDRVLALTPESESSQGYEEKYQRYRDSYSAKQPWRYTPN